MAYSSPESLPFTSILTTDPRRVPLQKTYRRTGNSMFVDNSKHSSQVQSIIARVTSETTVSEKNEKVPVLEEQLSSIVIGVGLK